MSADFLEFSLEHIKRHSLHGVHSAPPVGYLRGIDILGEDLVPAMRRSCTVFRRRHGYLPDLINPGSFSQKQLLFKFFGPIPLHSPSDKIGARNYLPAAYHDIAHIPKLVWSTDKLSIPSNEDIPAGRYWFKSNHSSGRNIPVIFPLSEAKQNRVLAAAKTWLEKIHSRRLALWWYEIFERRVYLEEHLSSSTRSADDWKFFVCNGKVIIYQHDQDRFGTHDQTIYDRYGNHINMELYYPGAKPVAPPKQLDAMRGIAEAVGEAFDFIRVDLFLRDDDIFFGEIGLVPNGCTIPIRSAVIDHILGASWSPPWFGEVTDSWSSFYNHTHARTLFDEFPVPTPDPGTIWNAKTVNEK